MYTALFFYLCDKANMGGVDVTVLTFSAREINFASTSFNPRSLLPKVVSDYLMCGDRALSLDTEFGYASTADVLSKYLSQESCPLQHQRICMVHAAVCFANIIGYVSI